MSSRDVAALHSTCLALECFATVLVLACKEGFLPLQRSRGSPGHGRLVEISCMDGEWGKVGCFEGDVTCYLDAEPLIRLSSLWRPFAVASYATAYLMRSSPFSCSELSPIPEPISAPRVPTQSAPSHARRIYSLFDPFPLALTVRRVIHHKTRHLPIMIQMRVVLVPITAATPHLDLAAALLASSGDNGFEWHRMLHVQDIESLSRLCRLGKCIHNERRRPVFLLEGESEMTIVGGFERRRLLVANGVDFEKGTVRSAIAGLSYSLSRQNGQVFLFRIHLPHLSLH